MTSGDLGCKTQFSLSRTRIPAHLLYIRRQDCWKFACAGHLAWGSWVCALDLLFFLFSICLSVRPAHARSDRSSWLRVTLMCHMPCCSSPWLEQRPPETVTLKSVNNVAKGSIIPIAESLTFSHTGNAKNSGKKRKKNLLKTHFKSWVDCWVAHCEASPGASP